MPISQPRILKDTLSRKAAIATGTAKIVKNISKIKNEIVNMIIPPTCALSPKYKLKVTQAGAACQPSCFLLPAASAPAVIVRMAVILPHCLVHLLVRQLLKTYENISLTISSCSLLIRWLVFCQLYTRHAACSGRHKAEPH